MEFANEIKWKHWVPMLTMSNSIIRTNYKDVGFTMTFSHSHKPQYGFIQFMRCFTLHNYLYMMPFDPSEIVEFKQTLQMIHPSKSWTYQRPNLLSIGKKNSELYCDIYILVWCLEKLGAGVHMANCIRFILLGTWHMLVDFSFINVHMFCRERFILP
jgi:hypothetical protein